MLVQWLSKGLSLVAVLGACSYAARERPVACAAILTAQIEGIHCIHPSTRFALTDQLVRGARTLLNVMLRVSLQR